MNVQRYARIAGVLFLVSLVAGGFGEGYVPAKVVVSGDAAATAANFRDLAFLCRLGFAAFLIESLCDITLALILYALLRPVNPQLSLLAAFFGLVGTAIFAVAELFFFMPVLVLGSAGPTSGFTAEQLNHLFWLSIKLTGFGGSISGLYYGISWIVRGYLIFHSGYLPGFPGVLMAIGGVGFVTVGFTRVLAPAYSSDLLLMLLIPGGLILTFWLLIKGVDVPKWNQRVNADQAKATEL